MKKRQTNIILLSSVISTLLVVGVFILFFKIIENKNKHISAVIQTLNDKIDKKMKDVELTKKISEVEGTSNTINNYFINTQQIDVFIDFLEKLGNTNGSVVYVESIDLPKDKSHTLGIKMLATGSFSNVINTISSLENSFYQIHINSINWNKYTQNKNKQNTKSLNSGSVYDGWQAEISFNILSS